MQDEQLETTGFLQLEEHVPGRNARKPARATLEEGRKECKEALPRTFPMVESRRALMHGLISPRRLPIPVRALDQIERSLVEARAEKAEVGGAGHERNTAAGGSSAELGRLYHPCV